MQLQYLLDCLSLLSRDASSLAFSVSGRVCIRMLAAKSIVTRTRLCSGAPTRQRQLVAHGRRLGTARDS